MLHALFKFSGCVSSHAFVIEGQSSSCFPRCCIFDSPLAPRQHFSEVSPLFYCCYMHLVCRDEFVTGILSVLFLVLLTVYFFIDVEIHIAPGTTS